MRRRDDNVQLRMFGYNVNCLVAVFLFAPLPYLFISYGLLAAVP